MALCFIAFVEKLVKAWTGTSKSIGTSENNPVQVLVSFHAQSISLLTHGIQSGQVRFLDKVIDKAFPQNKISHTVSY